MRSPAERILLVQQTVAKFRKAIWLQPEFDRACYNLGAVYYAHACSLSSEAQSAGNRICHAQRLIVAMRKTFAVLAGI